ncbi:MAG: ribonuclease D [Gammaproteobacteria bacterium]|nr:ribonuclease D [Gammaproteobacteria bacterium]
MPDNLIENPSALTAVCEQLRARAWIALDTEFMRTRTYYARLCLVQAATPDLIACIDPLVLPHIEPLLDVIYAPQVLKIFHSARQDLEVLSDIRGVPPAPVFDTQIAASLCGYDDQIGYANLVESITGHKLPKLHTRADWEARPLPVEQLNYAEDDVRYLRDVYHFLAQKLEALGRSAWLAEECAALTDPALYRNDPLEAFRRLRQGHALSPAAQTILRQLAAWRERAAQQNNLPRSWVIADAALLAIAIAVPQTLTELEPLSELNGAAIRKWGAEIIDAVRLAQQAPVQRWWYEPQRLERPQQALYDRLQARIQAIATQIKISATLIAPRREVLKLIAGDSSSLTRGWRRTLIGEELQQMCLAATGSAATS